ncbi:MAG: hypothetical protein R3C55_02165 [Parvularculaceae bacterium]
MRAQSGDERRVPSRHIVFERERAGRCRQRVRRLDIVLKEDRHAVERAQRFAGSAPRIRRTRIGERIRIDGENRLQGRPCAIDLFDPLKISADKLFRRHFACGKSLRDFRQGSGDQS